MATQIGVDPQTGEPIYAPPTPAQLAAAGFTPGGHVIPTITVGGVERKATPSEQAAFDAAYRQTAGGKEIAAQAAARVAYEQKEAAAIAPSVTTKTTTQTTQTKGTSQTYAKTPVYVKPPARSSVKGVVIGTSPTEGKVLVRDEFGMLLWQIGTPEQIAEADMYLASGDKYDKPYVAPESEAPVTTIPFTLLSPKELMEEYNRKASEFKDNIKYQVALENYNNSLQMFNDKWSGYTSNNKWTGTLSDYDRYKQELGELSTKSQDIQSQYNAQKAELETLANQYRGAVGTKEAQAKVSTTIISDMAKLKGVQIADLNNPTQGEIENLVKAGLNTQQLVDAGIDYSKVTTAIDTVNAQKQITGTVEQNQVQQTAIDKLKDYKTGDNKYRVQDYIRDNPTQTGLQYLKDAKFPQGVIDAAQKYLDEIKVSKSEIDTVIAQGKPLSGQATSLTNAISKAGFYKAQTSGNPVVMPDGTVMWSKDGKLMSDLDIAKAQWESLTDIQKSKVAELYALDLYRTDYTAEYIHTLDEIAKQGGIVGEIAFSPVLEIARPVAKALTKQEVTPLEWATAGATLVLDIFGLSGVAPSLHALGTGGKILAYGIPIAAKSVFVANTVVNWDKMDDTGRALSIVGNTLLFLPEIISGVKGYSSYVKAHPGEAVLQDRELTKVLQQNRDLLAGMFDNVDDAARATQSFDDFHEALKDYAWAEQRLKQAQKVVTDIGIGQTEGERLLIKQARETIDDINTQIPDLKSRLDSAVSNYSNVVSETLGSDSPDMVNALKDLPDKVTGSVDGITSEIVQPLTPDKIQSSLDTLTQTIADTQNSIDDLAKPSSDYVVKGKALVEVLTDEYGLQRYDKSGNLIEPDVAKMGFWKGIKEPDTLGIYKPRTDTIVLRNMDDVDAAVHELIHPIIEGSIDDTVVDSIRNIAGGNKMPIADYNRVWANWEELADIEYGRRVSGLTADNYRLSLLGQLNEIGRQNNLPNLAKDISDFADEHTGLMKLTQGRDIKSVLGDLTQQYTEEQSNILKTRLNQYQSYKDALGVELRTVEQTASAKDIFATSESIWGGEDVKFDYLTGEPINPGTGSTITQERKSAFGVLVGRSQADVEKADISVRPSLPFGFGTSGEPHELNKPLSSQPPEPDLIGKPLPLPEPIAPPSESPSPIEPPTEVPVPPSEPTPVEPPKPDWGHPPEPIPIPPPGTTPIPPGIPEPTPIPPPSPAPIPPPVPEPVPVPAPKPVPIPPVVPIPPITPIPPPIPFIPFIPSIPQDKEVAARLQKKEKGILEWRQGRKWVALFPPYTDNDKYYLDNPLPGTYKFFVGKGSAAKTLQVLGGSPEQDAVIDMGWATVKVSAKGKDLTMDFTGGTEAINKRWTDERAKMDAFEQAAYEGIPLKGFTEKIPKGYKLVKIPQTSEIVEENPVENLPIAPIAKSVKTDTIQVGRKPVKEADVYSRTYFGRRLRPVNLGVEL